MKQGTEGHRSSRPRPACPEASSAIAGTEAHNGLDALVLLGKSGRGLFSGTVSRMLSDHVVSRSFNLRKSTVALNPEIHVSSRKRGQRGKVSEGQTSCKRLIEKP